VIATLGGHTVRPTIQALNSGTLRPAEIILCLPKENIAQLGLSSEGNVRVHGTDFRGQVRQRIAGFRLAQFELVMQMDDDVELDVRCLQYLVETLGQLGSDAALAPAIMDAKTRRSVYGKPAKGRFLTDFYYWLMNGSEGYAAGKIDRSGSPMGLFVPPDDAKTHRVDWLAGGCVLHWRQNLVLEDYWLLPGKAFYEDVMHSLILTGRGLNLYIDARARCWIDVVGQSSIPPREYLRYLYRNFQARKYFMLRFSRWSARAYLFYIGRFVSYLFSIRGW
jgi:hypothetical protein